MIDEQPFLDTIKDSDDAAPRLVYADWLEEHGECDKALAIRNHVASKLTEYQWGILKAAVNSMVYSLSGQSRMVVGNYVYPIGDFIDDAKLRRAVFAGLRTHIKRQYDDAEQEILYPRAERKKTVKKWEKLMRRVFPEHRRHYAPMARALADRIYEQVKPKIAFKSIGIDSVSLANMADGVLISEICGISHWDYYGIDPSGIPNVAKRLRQAVDSFDAWAFDWSRCHHSFQPKIRGLMIKAGFVFVSIHPSRGV